jgi:ketosteroid isomerase-like protein
MLGPRDVVSELWSRIQARDWDGVGELLADDLVVDWPNAGLRIRSRANFVEFNRIYPEGWSIEVLQVVEEGSTAISEVRVPHPTVGPHYALSFWEVENGRIVRGREYWVEERAEDPSPERAHLFERTR